MASAFWFSVVKWLGAAYLAYVGIRLLMSKETLDVAAAHGGDPSGRNASIFAKSFLTAVTNPKGYLFFSAFLPQFLDPSAPLAPVRRARDHVRAARRGRDVRLRAARRTRGAVAEARGALWLERTCGAMLLALAGSLALYRRHAA